MTPSPAREAEIGKGITTCSVGGHFPSGTRPGPGPAELLLLLLLPSLLLLLLVLLLLLHLR